MENNNKKPNGYWTLERCQEEALKYQTKSEWAKSKGSSYAVALKNNWSKVCVKHMVEKKKNNNHWNNKENIAEMVSKYKTLSEWYTKSSASYNAARQNQWYQELSAHMRKSRNLNGYWCIERCLEESSKYSSIKEWKANNGSSYNAAKKNGWYDECTKNMRRYGK